jgi:hypothetical protein
MLMMQRPQELRHLVQLELFRSRPLTPHWRQLPAEVRRQTLPLLARLLYDIRLVRRAATNGQEVADE